MTKQKYKKQNGITLIALVITIIVMLILAGVTISIIVNGGLFTQAQNAKEATEQATADEQAEMIVAELRMKSYESQNQGKTVEQLLAETDTPGFSKNGNKITDDTGREYIINDDFTIIKKEKPKAEWADNVKEVIGGVPIPKGFDYIEGSKNTGLVIKNTTDQNEFVWVPCTMDGAGGSVKYEKWDGTTTYVNANDTTDDTLPAGIDEESQITKYGGFYIARYEAGYDEEMTVPTTNATDRKPLSKKNATVWNNIDYPTAKGRAESMYNTASVQSGLVTGTQWDTTMAWLGKTDNAVIQDSTNWGNYYNAEISNVTKYSDDYGSSYKTNAGTTKSNSSSWLLATGNTEYTNRKNIYDLAGNIWEWTNEKIYSSYRVIRGGIYGNSR